MFTNCKTAISKQGCISPFACIYVINWSVFTCLCLYVPDYATPVLCALYYQHPKCRDITWYLVGHFKWRQPILKSYTEPPVPNKTLNEKCTTLCSSLCLLIAKHCWPLSDAMATFEIRIPSLYSSGAEGLNTSFLNHLRPVLRPHSLIRWYPSFPLLSSLHPVPCKRWYILLVNWIW